MRIPLELIRAFISFFGINTSFFLAVVIVAWTRTYFGVGTASMDAILSIVYVWPQP